MFLALMARRPSGTTRCCWLNVDTPFGTSSIPAVSSGQWLGMPMVYKRLIGSCPVPCQPLLNCRHFRQVMAIHLHFCLPGMPLNHCLPPIVRPAIASLFLPHRIMCPHWIQGGGRRVQLGATRARLGRAASSHAPLLPTAHATCPGLPHCAASH